LPSGSARQVRWLNCGATTLQGWGLVWEANPPFKGNVSSTPLYWPRSKYEQSKKTKSDKYGQKLLTPIKPEHSTFKKCSTVHSRQGRYLKLGVRRNQIAHSRIKPVMQRPSFLVGSEGWLLDFSLCTLQKLLKRAPMETSRNENHFGYMCRSESRH
jgi:hypothetical protein